MKILTIDIGARTFATFRYGSWITRTGLSRGKVFRKVGDEEDVVLLDEKSTVSFAALFRIFPIGSKNDIKNGVE